MAPIAKKNCSVILYDFNTRNREIAKSTVLKIFGQKWFKTSPKQSRDMTRIIITNVDKTSDNLNVTKDGYENIYAATDKVNFDPVHLARIFNRKLEPSNADWIEALHVAINCLKTDFIDVNGIVSKQLLFITDLSTPLITSQSNKLKALIRDINEYKIYLYIVGPQVTYQHTITSTDDVRKAMETLTFPEENENTRMVREIIENTKNTVVCPYEMGPELFTGYVGTALGQPWQVPLTIGTKIELPTSTVRLTDGTNNFILVEDKQDNPTQVIWVDAEDEQYEVKYSDTVTGISRHDKFVPMDSTINSMFKCEGPRRFTLVGFTHKSNIPEYLFVGEETYAVLPNHKSPDQSNALHNLIVYLGNADMYGVAIQCYNAGNRPKYNVLIPKTNRSPKCFYMVQLPYSDDIKFTYEETEPPALKTDKNAELYSFLDSIDIDGERCEINMPLTPNLMHDSRGSRIVDKALQKYFDKQSTWTPVYYDPLNFNSSSHEEVWKKILPEMKIEEEIETGVDKHEADSDFEFQDDEY